MGTTENDLDRARLLDLSKEELIDLLEDQFGGGIQITFSGKANARRLVRKVRPRVQRYLPELSSGSQQEQADNLLIEGDNLQAMVTLYRERGQVDLILTDPPYNTGKDFRYNDKWDEDPNDPGLGKIVAEDDGARHTKWMRFMWPRLQLMRDMLKNNGVLAICIDQRELFRLGQMLDELFHEKNRLAIINWQRSYTRTNDTDHVATTTEYLLVYAKNEEFANTGMLPRNAGQDSNYGSPDGDPRPWDDGPATGSNAAAHKSMVYAIQNPFTGELLYPPRGSAWRHGQAQIHTWLKGWGCAWKLSNLNDEAERAAIIGCLPEEVPAVKGIILAEEPETAREKARAIYAVGPWPNFIFLKKGEGKPRVKRYLEEVRQGNVPTTFWMDDYSQPEQIGVVSWPHQVSGHGQQGVDELTAVVGPGHEFKTVKPLKLFEKVIAIWCPPNGLVFDPFAGSGTTGHAVLGMNATTGASRRFFLIEQGRPEKGDSYARSLTAQRLRRVITGDWASGQRAPLPGGVRFVTLEKKVDADVLLRMEREEMVDTVIASHFDGTRRRGPGLIPMTDAGYRYLVARNPDNEGIFLVWNGAKQNIDFTEDVYEDCVTEAAAAGLKRIYRVYARLYLYQTDDVYFYQIPDRILADFGLNIRNEAFNEVAE